MAIFFYNVFLVVYSAAARFGSAFSQKAKKWVAGRKNVFESLPQNQNGHQRIIWMHCASLGEFEQGRPVLESLRNLYPGYKILLSFFSPSGLEPSMKYPGADWVVYLPMDGRRRSKLFIGIVRPAIAIFVKYEYWYYYLKEVNAKKIPLILISAIYRRNMIFFRWYGGLFRKILSFYDQIFVQTAESKRLLDKLHPPISSSLSGDTRFDRVMEILSKWKGFPMIDNYLGDHKAIVAGSTWPEDDQMLKNSIESIKELGLRLIIAPHDITQQRLENMRNLFPDCVFYSQLATARNIDKTDCLVIDNIGMLSGLYKYGYINYVGGGLKKTGVHNVLEAAVFSRVVLFGPFYQDYAEAVELVLAGGGLPFNYHRKQSSILGNLVRALVADKKEYAFRSEAAGDFVRKNAGATGKIISYIQEKRLLTN